jgi:DNA-binding NarL/FixJ family response regulator
VQSAARRTAVILDRLPLWLEAVETVLERVDVTVVGKAVSASRALNAVAEHKPDLFITDLALAGGESEALRCIRLALESCPELRVLVLSSISNKESIDGALQAGAAAYVMKGAHPEDLASAVRQAFAHSVYFAADRQLERTSLEMSNEAAELTRRELEILRLVAQGHSNAQVARMLWVTEQTVKFHLSNIYRKTKVSNRTEASRWAQVNGLLTADAGQPLGRPG